MLYSMILILVHLCNTLVGVAWVVKCVDITSLWVIVLPVISYLSVCACMILRKRILTVELSEPTYSNLLIVSLRVVG